MRVCVRASLSSLSLGWALLPEMHPDGASMVPVVLLLGTDEMLIPAGGQRGG